MLKGDVLTRLRKYTEAMESYSIAVGLAPQSTLFRKIGRIHVKLMQSDEAKENSMNAARLEPESVLNYSAMGFVALLEGRLEHAYTLFSQAIAIDPLCDEAHVGLSKTLLESCDVEEAQNAVKTAIHCAPNNEDA